MAMNLSDEAKAKAMAAVANIRQNVQAMPMPKDPPPQPQQAAVSTDVKAKADAAAQTIKQDVKPLPGGNEIAAPTPAQRDGAVQAQQRIAEMAKSGKDASEISKTASKDDFGRH